jgi:polyphosphate kinase 2
MNIEFTPEILKKLNTKRALSNILLGDDPINYNKAVKYYDYVGKLKKLQVELIKQQACIIDNNQRVIVIFEGRDAAGKGGAIRRITERINPRHFRIVALPKPTKDEKTQWYFQRYVSQFPKAGEMLLFDRSWYNRAIVEPVNGFCTPEDYRIFMNQVNEFERMITESGIQLVKIYMSISKAEQQKRFLEIKNNPLKQWKMTKVDEKAQNLWNSYTQYKSKMFENAKKGVPFKVISANKKQDARIETIRHLLTSIPYDKNRKV